MEKAIIMDRSVLVMTPELGDLSLLFVGRTKQVEPDSQGKPRRALVVVTLGLFPGLGESAGDGRKATWVEEGCGL